MGPLKRMVYRPRGEATFSVVTVHEVAEVVETDTAVESSEDMEGVMVASHFLLILH